MAIVQTQTKCTAINRPKRCNKVRVIIVGVALRGHPSFELKLSQSFWLHGRGGHGEPPPTIYFAEAAVASSSRVPLPPAWAWKVPDPGVSFTVDVVSDQFPWIVRTGNAVTAI